ncbi:MAG: chalcone isomerase family protein [Rubrivivax sp.]
MSSSSRCAAPDAGPAALTPAASARRRLLGGICRAGVWCGVAGASDIGFAAPAPPASPPPEVQQHLASARLHGQGRLRVFGVRVYDARLWVGAGFVAARWPDAALALEIDYALPFNGPSIADRSVQEMARQQVLPAATADRWRADLERLLPDVAAGDRLTGLHRPGEGLALFHNGAARGTVPDATLAARFFGIWLARATSAPALRESLLGPGV